MKMKKIAVLILSSMTFMVMHSYAQNFQQAKEKSFLTQEPKKIRKAFMDNKTGKFYRVFIDKISSDKDNVVSITNGILLENGEQIILSENEEVIGISQNVLSTFKIDPDRTEIKNYKIIGSNLVLNRSRKLDFKSYYVSKIHERIIVSDEFEGYGSIFNIYSQDLNVITSYIPFESGFSFSAIVGDENKTVVYTSSIKNPEVTKLSAINNDGKILFEKMITTGKIVPKQVYLVGDFILTYSSHISNEYRTPSFISL